MFPGGLPLDEVLFFLDPDRRGADSGSGAVGGAGRWDEPPEDISDGVRVRDQ